MEQTYILYITFNENSFKITPEVFMYALKPNEQLIELVKRFYHHNRWDQVKQDLAKSNWLKDMGVFSIKVPKEQVAEGLDITHADELINTVYDADKNQENWQNWSHDMLSN